MLDQFREEADSSLTFDDDGSNPYDAPPKRPFLGMTPLQRFVVALMLLVITCVLSAFCLIVTGKIVLPF